MWRITQLWFDIKRVTWFRFLCFIHGHDIQDLDPMYPNHGTMCFRCYQDGKDVEYEYGVQYWLNRSYVALVEYTEYKKWHWFEEIDMELFNDFRNSWIGKTRFGKFILNSWSY